jgi:hypothetical protein
MVSAKLLDMIGNEAHLSDFEDVAEPIKAVEHF